MWKHSLTGRLALAAIIFICMHGVASAQATRTWVSGVGDDANPCSRTAPCKTFAGAISKTAAGGEISVLDPGGFGGVTITKSITINNNGGEAGVVVSGTNAIIINAATTDRVTLRGLTIEGLGTGLNGIRVISAAEVVIEDCAIEGFRGASPSYGILVAPTAGTVRVTVRNSTINANGQPAASGGGGIGAVPTGNSYAIVDIDGVNLAHNNSGVVVDGSGSTYSAWATVRNSQITGNGFDGVLVRDASGGSARVVVKDNAIAGNGFATTTAAGVRADGAVATARIEGNIITVNRNGVLLENGGTIYSYGDNMISGNTSNGSFTSTQATQ
ncbi:right-handed parallel beta-helix repeat-containing protein [Lysobacter niabensis]|uniref:right-handed parallel beta-helix repeat-containing protein n=1 Tax=Agrilutibacter niabensis TaxID=380628 RepID=UPI0036086178